MNKRDLEWMNKKLSCYTCNEESKYDKQGRVLETNDTNDYYSNKILVNYNGEDIETTQEIDHKTNNEYNSYCKSLYKLCNMVDYNGENSEYVELRKEDIYDKDKETILTSNFYQEGNEDYIEHREYYNKEKYSKVVEFISDDNGFEVDEVRYWKKKEEKEHLDFGVIYNEGEYKINKYKDDALEYSVDLGTLVDEYDKNRKEEK